MRAVGCAGLARLVSDVRLAEYGPDALRENLERLDWLDDVARAHHRVIDAAALRFALLPTRLATVYSGDAAVRATLTARAGRLRRALERVGGSVEWGVKAYAAAPPDPGTRPGPGTGTGKQEGAGMAYLNRRRAQLTAGQEARAAAVRQARALHGRLAGRAADARLHPPQAPQLSGSRLPMLLTAAYLIAADGGAEFSATVTAEADAHPELWVELTGPWPPYSFAGETGEENGS